MYYISDNRIYHSCCSGRNRYRSGTNIYITFSNELLDLTNFAGYNFNFQANVFQWRTIFFISAGFYLIGNLFYVIFGTGEEQPWNKLPDKIKNDTKNNEMAD